MTHNKFFQVLIEAAKIADQREKKHLSIVENRRKSLHLAAKQIDLLLDGRRSRANADSESIDYELIRDHLSRMTDDEMTTLSISVSVHIDEIKRISNDEDVPLNKRQATLLAKVLDDKIILKELS